jgi:hypothetical protein
MKNSNHEADSSAPREGWILYDGTCGFCFRWVHLRENVVLRRGFAVKDLQSAYADGSLLVPQKEQLDEIRVLTRTGKLESGGARKKSRRTLASSARVVPGFAAERLRLFGSRLRGGLLPHRLGYLLLAFPAAD